MSLTELDDGLVRRMAMGAVFSDFVRTNISLFVISFDFGLNFGGIQLPRLIRSISRCWFYTGREDTFGGFP